MITLDTTLMNFNPYTAVEEKLNMRVTRKGDTYTFKFDNGYIKQKRLHGKREVKMYYIFLEKVYNKNPKEFSQNIEKILKGHTPGEHVSISFKEAKKGLRCKVEVTYYDDDGRVASSSKRGGDILACYEYSRQELHKKLSEEPATDNVQVDASDVQTDNMMKDIIAQNTSLLNQIERKDVKIEELEQRLEVSQIINENNIQKEIIKYTKCPICGEEQILKDSMEGKPFVGCSHYNDDPTTHKGHSLPYDDFAKMLYRVGLLRDYYQWRYDH